MKAFKAAVIGAGIGAVLWATLLVGGLLYAMFTTPGYVNQRTSALWGAVYFETIQHDTYADMVIGLGNVQVAYILLLTCILACTGVGLLVNHCHHKQFASNRSL
ncbi:hypothetical protein F6S87_04370 [Bifidobacterium sp. BRDM6]|uniref:Uncharacterized protein n=1 Tax=Bifidobacterium choloepi TaxID=2614131 RepID=A0A6I5N2H1_9BIFI|nr:hypothetical protein [Bifidobacterium choloepi]